MIFSRVSRAKSVVRIADSIERALLDNKAVLWLVSGGSAVESQVAIMEQLAVRLPDKLDQLTILPVDERYGVLGHSSSNSQQMRQAGFRPRQATWIDVLEHGTTKTEVVRNYNSITKQVFSRADTVIATLGLGADGHTAGILPGSLAVTDTTSGVVAYAWTDYERMTLGLVQLRQIDSAFVLAYGENKQSALERLRANKEPLSALPAKVLYDIPNVTVYNDYIESEG